MYGTHLHTTILGKSPHPVLILALIFAIVAATLGRGIKGGCEEEEEEELALV